MLKINTNMKGLILNLMLALALFTANAQDQEKLTFSLDSVQYKQAEKYFAQKQKVEKSKTDWAKFYKYAEANKKLTKPVRVVFMGNSITERWNKTDSSFFFNNKFVCRGISGQTSYEMLARFQADVINLRPFVVVISAGTNDIAQNYGIIPLENIMQNIISMCELARLHRIKPILTSVLPAFKFNGWRKELSPAQDIIKLNNLIKTYAEQSDIPYVDYYSALVDERNGLPEKYSKDGVHPTMEGYTIMEPLILRAIRTYIKN